MSGVFTPGQHLHAIMVAFFRGGGWVEAPEWDDFDPAGHLVWEAHAQEIGRNIRAAAVAPELLEALRAIEPFAAIDEWMDERERDEVVRLREQARAAILKATGTTPNNKQSEGK